MGDSNMALLSQEEIDTLVKFINQKRSSVGADVLPQRNIDQIIKMLERHTMLEYASEVNNKVVMDNSKVNGCELKIDFDKNGYINTYIELDGQRIIITPKCLESGMIVEDSDRWGKTISPVLFDSLAQTFGLKYTQNTYETVCARHSEIVYGDSQLKSASVYLPTSKELTDRVI